MYKDLTIKVVPSPAWKRTVYGQVLVYATHRQPVEPLTGQSTPRGRNWLGPSPISSVGSEGLGNTAENPWNSARRPAADGKQAGSSLPNLETKVQ